MDRDQESNFAPDTFHTPAIVMLDPELQPLDSKLYAIIYWLERLKDGKCWASNKALGKWCGASSSGVANSLVRLRDQKYIACLYDDKGNRLEIKTLVYYTVNPYSNEEGGVTQMSNIDSKKLKRIYTSEMLKSIDRVYDIWLKTMVVDPDVRFSEDVELKRSALQEAKKRTRLTDKRKTKIAARVESMGVDRVLDAVIQISKSEFHRDGILSNGDKGTFKADLEWLCHSDERVESWANKKANR